MAAATRAPQPLAWDRPRPVSGYMLTSLGAAYMPHPQQQQFPKPDTSKSLGQFQKWSNYNAKLELSNAKLLLGFVWRHVDAAPLQPPNGHLSELPGAKNSHLPWILHHAMPCPSHCALWTWPMDALAIGCSWQWWFHPVIHEAWLSPLPVAPSCLKVTFYSS